jgi:hypothetical protein
MSVIDQSDDVAVAGPSMDHSIDRTRGHELRYRLVVAARDTADVVALSGGWLFDRVMAGWHATVLTADTDDRLPLRILGAEAADLREAMALRNAAAAPQSFAVTAALYESDEQVRRWVRRALDSGLHEITLWGDSFPEELAARTDSAQHRPSSAARAFKARALRAASASGHTADEIESFRRAGGPRRAAVDYGRRPTLV